MGKRRRQNHQMNRKRANPAWKDIVKENELLESYYRSQQIVSEEDWDTFIKFCRKDLPSTFRISKIRGHAKDLLASLKNGYISQISEEDIKSANTSEKLKDEEESEENLVLEPISWYPNELAWNSNLSRRFIRRSEVLQKLHRFLVEDSECGAITRQEAVSMIPPMLLDVQPHHIVLDMCAAPGSKTTQIIELMHENGQQELPTGAVLANDSDHKRCYMLTHQAKRLNTPCVVITNHDASVFPKLYSQSKEGSGSEPLSFDRVLCDVPCSGDGTLRKNPLIWNKWTPHLGVALHKLQIKILIRGLELLKVGGRLVYSTCSFNPIENEAVLATVLSNSVHSVELVDCSDEIPGLKRSPGLLTWKVFDRNGQEFKTFSDINCSPTEGFKETMFPPSEEIANSLNLHHAIRVYPHLQNTGGFFIAVLHKKDELPWQKAKRSRNLKYLPWDQLSMQNVEDDLNEKNVEINLSDITEGDISGCADSVVAEDGTSNDSAECVVNQNENEEEKCARPPLKKVKRGMIKQDPYNFLDDDDKDLSDVRDFYDMVDELPSRQFLVRSNNDAVKKRHVYLVSKAVREIMNENKNLKIVNTGVRVFTRSQFKAGFNEHGVEFRLVQDGLHLLQKFLKKRIIEITYEDLVSLITLGEPYIDVLNSETQLALSKLDMGCVVWHYNASSGNENGVTSLSENVSLCGHYGRKIVQCMLSREERKHFLRLLGAPIPDELQIKIKGESWGDEGETNNSKEDKLENADKSKTEK